jgi:catechol 2,3-dioxygenase-like lactoylglutathione lyase family enzyme
MCQRLCTILLFVATSHGLQAQEVEPASFHHVRLNATDPAKSIKYYEKHFGAVPIKFKGVADALFVERSFLLFNKVESPPPQELVSGIWHIGWGGVDIVNEYEWMRKRGVDFHTTPQPLIGPDNFYMYIKGPDGELIEVNTMGHHRFAHVHFFATDVNETCAWYAKHLGLKPRRAKVNKPKGKMDSLLSIWMNFIQCDNVLMIFFGKPDVEPPPPWWPDAPLKEIQPTKGRPIDHIAFSYRDIGPVYERMKADGVEIVSEPALQESLNLKGFSVLGPDKVLIEIVEAKPIPEGVWE